MQERACRNTPIETGARLFTRSTCTRPRTSAGTAASILTRRGGELSRYRPEPTTPDPLMLTGGAASAVRSVVTGAVEACQGSSQAQCGPNGAVGNARDAGGGGEPVD